MVRFFRRRFIVDAKFQWTVILYTLVISLFTSVAHITILRLQTLSQALVAVKIGPLTLDPRILIWVVVGSGYLALFLVGVLFSNRLAGPLYRLRRHMADTAKGENTPSAIHFRRGDYYAEITESYNKLLARFAPQNPDDKGFSLIEMMVVVGISSLLAVIAVASFTGGTADMTRLKEQGASLREVLVNARNLAISGNQCVLVTVTSAQVITVTSYVMTPACTGALPLPPATETVKTFPAEVTISHFDVGESIMFRPNGGTTITTPAKINIKWADNNFQRYTIYPAIGQVRQL